MPQKRKFTRIPKIPDLIAAGVPIETIPTYACLADHANNRTGECWPSMKRLAEILGRSVRTVQRHLHTLKECGMVEFVERRRHKGKFSSYTYRVLHILTTGQGRPMAKKRSNKRRTKPSRTTPKSPSKNVKEGYEWLFDDTAPADTAKSKPSDVTQEQKAAAGRRTDGYEWLFERS